MFRDHFFKFAFPVFTSVFLFAIQGRAVDFQAFEFTGGAGAELFQVSNTGTPGGQSWVQSNALLDSSTDGSGNFRIAKFGNDQADNYLQIDNITETTTNSRYIVVRMSGWNFVQNDIMDPGEQIRFDFLDNDTGTSGANVTSQIRIDRNPDGSMELRGTAIGVGSTNITSRATLNTTQTNPFTMVLELNKVSNSYEIFYKDGTNPSQALGLAPISPGRNGNSMRFTVFNDFGTTGSEFFSIDRIALTDTNPLTDLMTLEVNRDTGVMKLVNTSGAALSGLRSYSITSGSGALNDANWKSVTEFYDQGGSVDDGAWAKTSTTTGDLSENAVGGNGGNLAINQEVILSKDLTSGPWIKNPIEDLEITLHFDSGPSRKANVNFVGNGANGGKRFAVGDLTFDGLLTPADWTAFNLHAETNLAGLSQAQAYQAGDLNNDGFNNIFDFSIFKEAYVAANGPVAFQALITGVPEPTTAFLLMSGSLLLLGCRRGHVRDTHANHIDIEKPNQEHIMNHSLSKLAGLVVALTLVIFASGTVQAGILEDFQFNDTNGTLLGSAENSANPGNMWGEDPVNMTESSVQSGKYNIMKANDEHGTSFLDIENITAGKAWLVAEMSGWNFTTPAFDSGQLEQVRFAFLNNDGAAQGGSFITAQANIQRNSTGGIELVGALTTGQPEMGPLALAHNRTTPFTVVVEIDEDLEKFSVYYKDDIGPFTQLGTAQNHLAGRNGNSIRLSVNNNFGGAGEFFNIDRIYLTDTNPTNINPDRMTLQVDAATGLMRLTNDTSTTIQIDAYTISSSTVNGDLNFAGWNSLSEHIPLIDPVDGTDGGSTAGDGIGETWDETPGSSDKVLAERFLLGKSVFSGNSNRTEMLGNGFKVGGDINSLTFQYRNADTGDVVTGNIVPASLGINADFDGDGDIDGRDFLRWQRGLTSPAHSPAALAAWQAQYNGGALQAAVQSVPEPGSILLVGMALVGAGCCRRRTLLR